MIDPSFAAISGGWEWLGGVALLVLLWRAVRFTINRFDEVDVRHTKSIERIAEDNRRIAEDHRQERTEWRESNEKSHKEVRTVIEELTDVIRDAGGRGNV